MLLPGCARRSWRRAAAGDDSESDSATPTRPSVEETTDDEDTTRRDDDRDGDRPTERRTDDDDLADGQVRRASPVSGRSSRSAMARRQRRPRRGVGRSSTSSPTRCRTRSRTDFEVIADELREDRRRAEGRRPRSGETPSRRTLAKLQELGQSLDTAEVQQATDNIEAWAQRELLARGRRERGPAALAGRRVRGPRRAVRRQSRSAFGSRKPSATAGSAGRPSRSKT